MTDDHLPADEGHTFRLAVSMRGSSKVVGDLHHRDAPSWDELGPVEVRAWDLPSALISAAALPFSRWFGPETEHRRAPPAASAGGLPVDPVVVEATGDALFTEVKLGIRRLRRFMAENPGYKSPATREALEDYDPEEP